MRKKLLLIDDEVIISAYLSSFFRNAGYDVKVAASGAEGVLKADAFHPDLVLLDLVLPDMDGVAVLAQLKEKSPKLPVIVVTGLAPEEEILADCSEHGVDGFVTKESTVDHQLMHVKRFIG
jgi:two-component system OmpR family response regulator